MELITRAEAKARGLKRYFTNKPCKHGHVAERFVSGLSCVECGLIKQHEWNQRNPGRSRQLQQRWRSKHQTRLATEQRQRKRLQPWRYAVLRAKQRAKARDLLFDITPEWATARWTGRCELSGLLFEQGDNQIVPLSPSIDRIDQSLGYIQRNCRFICMALNAMRGGCGTDEQMVAIASALVDRSQMLQQPTTAA